MAYWCACCFSLSKCVRQLVAVEGGAPFERRLFVRVLFFSFVSLCLFVFETVRILNGTEKRPGACFKRLRQKQQVLFSRPLVVCTNCLLAVILNNKINQAAVEALTSAAVEAVSGGADVIVLSDKTDQGD